MRRSALLLAALLPLAACDDAPGNDAGAAMTAPTRDALALLPAGAPTLGMFDVQEATSAGALGGAFEEFERAGGEAAARMDELERRTGFDPERDLDRVYFAVSDQDAPLFVIKARMDRDRLVAFLDEQPEMTRSSYRDLPVFSAQDDSDRFTIALLSNDLALAGSSGDVRAAADRALDGGPSAATDPAFTALLARARHGEAWLVSRDGMSPHGSHGPAFSVDAGVLSMDFDDDGVDVSAVAQPAAGASADDLAEAIEGAVALARVQALDDAGMRDLLDGVDVRTRDGMVEVRGAIPSAYIESMNAR